MKKAKRFLIWIIFLQSLTVVNGQQEIILTKYMYNAVLFNPAYAGSHGYGQGTVLAQYRNQWIGLPGAPSTILMAGEVSLAKDKVGLGISLGKESIGIDARTDIAVNYSYQVELGKGRLGAGLRGSLSQYQSDFSGLIHVESNDPVYAQPEARFSLFAVGAGLYYNTENAYAGISIPAISVIRSTNGGTFGARHMYFHAGMMMGNENGIINAEPSVLLSYQRAAPLQLTLGLNLWYDQKYAVGAHFRSQDALALSAEVFLQQRYRLSLAYDFTISDIQKYSDGTLELMMAYHFYRKPEIKRIKSLRYGGRF